jgi:hypothetical protein
VNAAVRPDPNATGAAGLHGRAAGADVGAVLGAAGMNAAVRPDGRAAVTAAYVRPPRGPNPAETWAPPRNRCENASFCEPITSSVTAQATFAANLMTQPSRV